MRRLTDYVFGYDFFISYKQEDGHQYPRQLLSGLSKEGFRVFLDESGFSAGDDLLMNTKRRVRMSSYLLLIGRPGALKRSDWVVREVEECIRAKNIPIVVDIDNCFLTVEASSHEEGLRLSKLRGLLEQRLRIEEVTGAPAGAVFDGMPSEQIFRELKRSFAGRRQDSRRARVFGVAAVMFGLLAIVAVWLAVASTLARNQAEREARRSRVGELAAQARLVRERQPQLATLLAAEAAKVVHAVGEPVPVPARQALVEAVMGLAGEGIPGHGAELGALDISVDGRWWALGGDDGSVQLWEATSAGDLTLVVTLPHAGKTNVRFAAFSASSSWLVTAGDGGDGCFLSLANKQTPQCLPLAPSEFLFDVKISPDRRWVSAAGLHNKVLLWDLSQPDPSQSVAEIGHDLESARYVQFSRDSNWLIVRGIESPAFWFWDLSKSPIARDPSTFHAHQAGVGQVAIDSKNGRLASIDEEGRVYLWRREDNQWRHTELMAASADRVVVNDLTLSPSGNWLAASISPGRPQDEAKSTLHVWRLSNERVPTPARKFSLDSTVRSLDFNPAGQMLYIEGLNGKLWVLDLTNELTADPMPLPGHFATVTQHAFTPDSRFLVTGDNDRSVMLWDFGCKPTVPTPISLTGHEGAIRTLKFGPGARWLASTSDDGTARRWNMTQTLPGDSLTLARACESNIAAAQISNNGVWLASGTENGTVFLHDLTADVPSNSVRQLQNDDGSSIENLWFDPTSKRLVAANKNQTLDIWDLTARTIGDSRRNIKRPQRSAGSIGFTPEGRRLAVRASGGTALIIDLTQNDPDAAPTVLSVPGQEIDDVVLSADGRWLAGNVYDRLVVWDLSQPSSDLHPISLPPFDSFISAVHFTHDSKRLIGVDNSGNLRAWFLPIDGQQKPLAFNVADRSADVLFSQDDQWAAVTTTVQPHLKVFRLTDVSPQHSSVVPKGVSEANGRIAWSSDSRWLTYASGGTVQLWKTSQLDSQPWVLSAHSGVEKVIFSKDTHWLAFGSDRGDVSVVEMTSEGPLVPFSVREHLGSITFLDFDPRSRSTISQSYNRLRLTPFMIPELLGLANKRAGRNFHWLEWHAYFHSQSYRKTFDRLPILTDEVSK